MNLLFDTVPFTIGDTRLEATRLNVAESRSAWSLLTPSLPALMAAVEVEAADGVRMGFLATAALGGLPLPDKNIDELIRLFAKHTTRVDVRASDAGEQEDRVLLSGNGQLDATFGGSWESVVEWLDFSIDLNFRGQFEKQLAAKNARETAALSKAAKAQPKE